MTGLIEPLFIYALPRSGSTMLQKLLASNPYIHTVAEPWFLLPLIYSRKIEGVYAEYSHFCVPQALDDFLQNTPRGCLDYNEAIREMATSLYHKASPSSARYFLDKTPRYCLISSDINEIFYASKRIYLWRHPLAIVASIVQTFLGGRWRIFHYNVDIYDGLERVLTEYRRDHDSGMSVSMNYEYLVANVDEELSRLEGFLSVDCSGNRLPLEDVELPGRMGDPGRSDKYKTVSTNSIDAWKKVVKNPLRKWWCRRYVLWIGRERVEMMGYDFDGIIADLDNLPFSMDGFVMDVFDIVYGFCYRMFEFKIMKDKVLRKKMMKHD